MFRRDHLLSFCFEKKQHGRKSYSYVSNYNIYLYKF